MQELNSKTQKAMGRNSYAVHFLNPKKIIDDLEIASGMSVAHFGCGTGFFTFPIAEKIGGEGVIYALDVLPEKIEVVKSQAKLFGLGNIIAQRVNLENESGSGLEDESMDWVIMTSVLYQNSKKDQLINEAKRILKKNGKALLIDWENIDSSIGPNIKSRISKDEIMEIIRKNELGILKEIKVSSFHFGLVLVK